MSDTMDEPITVTDYVESIDKWRELTKEEAEEHEREMQEIAMQNHMETSAINCYGMMNLLKCLDLIDKDVDIHEFIKMLLPKGVEDD